MATVVSLNAVDQTSLMHDMVIEERLGSRAALRATMVHTVATRPVHNQEITVAIDGTTYFAGPILGTEERSAVDNRSKLTTILTAGDYAHYPDRIVAQAAWEIDGTHPSGWTLKQLAQYVLDTWLNETVFPYRNFGITLHPSQVDGPTFTERIAAEWVTVTDVLNQFTVLSGYVWSIDTSKRLRFELPSSKGGTALTSATILTGAVLKRELSDYCNIVYVLIKGPQTHYQVDATSNGVAGFNHWHRFINAPEVETIGEATQIATQMLSRHCYLPTVLSCRTRTLGYHPGQTVLVTLPTHGISAETYTVQAVTYRRAGRIKQTGTNDAGSWFCDLELLGGIRTGGTNWVDHWQQLVGGTNQSIASIGGATFNYTISGSIDFQAFLGGSRHISVQHAGSYTLVPNYVNVSIDSTKYSGLSIKARVWLRTEAAATSVTPQIYNVTDGVVAGTGTAATNTSWQETSPQEFDITLGTGVKLYQLRVLPSAATVGVYAIGVLYVA